MNRREDLPVTPEHPDLTSERQIIDVFLQPGEFYFGDADTRIRTILGSCVAITLWHPRLRIGGMCHFLLPSRGSSRRRAELDGRYCDEAMDLFAREIRHHRTRASEYEAKAFGGGNMFPHQTASESLHIGRRNADSALHHLEMLGVRVTQRHLYGAGHRQAIFEVWSGDVWLRHVEL